MARIRTIKPVMFGSETLATVSRDARWTFAGLFTLADDEGRLRDYPKQIAGDLYPHEDDVTASMVSGWITELARIGSVVRYTVEGKRYLYLPGFPDHQSISKPTPSRLPPPPSGTPGVPADSQEPPGVPAVEVGSRKLEVGSRKENSSGRSAPDSDPVADDFDEAWSKYPKRERRKEALKAYRARRKSGVSAQDLLAATEHYAAAMVGTEPQFVMLGPTFYGPNDRWRDYLDPASARSKARASPRDPLRGRHAEPLDALIGRLAAKEASG